MRFYLAIIFIAFNSIEAQLSACPNVVSRAAWGARPAKSAISKTLKTVQYAVIHHSASTSCTTKASCMKLISGFQKTHMDVNRWDDIGYNFLVGEDGNVYEGRGWQKSGAHAKAYNQNSIGICVIGDFSKRAPNQAALNAVKKLIQCSVAKGYLAKNYGLRGHRDGNPTECPGSALYKEIKSWPRFGQ